MVVAYHGILLTQEGEPVNQINLIRVKAAVRRFPNGGHREDHAKRRQTFASYTLDLGKCRVRSGWTLCYEPCRRSTANVDVGSVL